MPDFSRFGVSFQPSDSAQAGQPQPPLQEAIRLLNLRLPSVIGAQAPVNQGLLTAPGLQGMPDMQFIRQLLGQFAPSAVPDSPRHSSAPSAPPSGGGAPSQNPESPGGGFPGGSVIPMPNDDGRTPPREDRGPGYDPESSRTPRVPRPRIIIGPRPPGQDGTIY